MVEFSGCACLEVGSAGGGETFWVDVKPAFLSGEEDADIVLDYGVRLPCEGAVNIDGCSGHGGGIGLLTLGEDGGLGGSRKAIGKSINNDLDTEGAVKEDVEAVVNDGGTETSLVE